MCIPTETGHYVEDLRGHLKTLHIIRRPEGSISGKIPVIVYI